MASDFFTPDINTPDDSAAYVEGTSIEHLTKQEQVEIIADWFTSHFWDPAEETPYNSREGGYLYINGGPYEAPDEIWGTFDGLASEEAIEEAIEQVQSDGILEWAPGRLHPNTIAIYEEAQAEEEQEDIDPLNKIKEQISDGIEPHFGDEEYKTRQQLLSEIEALEKIVNAKPLPSGIGHNQPPEAIHITEEINVNLTVNLNIAANELEKEHPDTEKVVEAVGVFRKILSWGASKLNLAIDQFIGELSKRSADLLVISPILPALSDIYTLFISWLNTIFN